jgi:DNA-binding MarR family transcriptional regulator
LAKVRATHDPTRDRVRHTMAVIDATRGLFHRMKAAADQVHSKTGITAGLRGVLQDLHKNGPRTVPDMARARPVSRQHIQVLVNELLERGEVELIPNPAHARSKLVRLTDRGREQFEAIRRREMEVLAELPVEAEAHELATTAEVLRRLKGAFEDPGWLTLVEQGADQP